MKKKKLVRVCPQCGSKEISFRGMISSKALSPNYVCLTCGFQGPLFPQINEMEAKNIPDRPRNFVSSRLPIFATKYEKHKKTKLVAIIGFIIMIFLLLLLLLF